MYAVDSSSFLGLAGDEDNVPLIKDPDTGSSMAKETLAKETGDTATVASGTMTDYLENKWVVGALGLVAGIVIGKFVL